MTFTIALLLLVVVMGIMTMPRAFPDNFIPEIWSKKLQKNFDASVVFKARCNTDYEGEIRQAGDTIKIRRFGNISIQDYTGAPLTDDTLTDPLITVAVTKARGFSFAVDDVDRAQSDLAIMEGYTERAGVAMGQDVDTYIHSVMAAGADAGNAVGSTGAPITPAAGTIYGYFVDMSKELDLANQPKEGRWAVVTPGAAAVLRKSTEMTHATEKGDQVIAGDIGYEFNVAGFRVYQSNRIPLISASYYEWIFGTGDFTSFANQFTNMRAEYVQGTFKQRILGVNVYDAWAIHPTAGGVVYSTL